MTTPVVLTGGIGSGKSTVARLLADHGATIVEADRIGHEVLASDGPAFEAVADRWPSVIVDGEVDRRALGRIVFDDPDELAALEALTHPEIHRRIMDRLRGVDGLTVVEIPIPVGWIPDDWPVVVVDAPDDVRVERLRRRGMDADEVDRRMGAQPTRAEWLERADHVVDNAGDEDALTARVERLVADLRG